MTIQWTSVGNQQPVEMIAFDSQNRLWSVQQGTVYRCSVPGRWDPLPGEGAMKMIFFINHELYGVGVEGDLLWWRDEQAEWIGMGKFEEEGCEAGASWEPKMFALDQRKGLWSVGEGGTLGGRVGFFGRSLRRKESSHELEWVTFGPDGVCYGVKSCGSLVICKLKSGYSEDGIDQEKELRMVTWDRRGNLWGVCVDGGIVHSIVNHLRQEIGVTLVPIDQSAGRSHGDGGRQLAYVWSEKSAESPWLPWSHTFPPALKKGGEITFFLPAHEDLFARQCSVSPDAKVELKVAGAKSLGIGLGHYRECDLDNEKGRQWGPYAVPESGCYQFRAWLKVTEGHEAPQVFLVDPEMIVGDGSEPP